MTRPAIHGFSDSPRPAEWSEVTVPKTLETLRACEKQYPKGKLVKLGAEFAWGFRERGIRTFLSVDDAGMIQIHGAF